MENHEEKPSLPRVEQNDIDAVYLEELIDEKHIVEWLRFYITNPILFKKVQERAYLEITQSQKGHEDASQLYVRILNTTAFALRALEVALERQSEEEYLRDRPINVDGDGEDPQP